MKILGLDKLTAETLKLIQENRIHIIVGLMNTIYRTGIIQKARLTLTFKILLKDKCMDSTVVYTIYRTGIIPKRKVELSIHNSFKFKCMDSAVV